MDICHVSKQNVEALKTLNLRESAEKIREISKWTAQGMVEIGSELKWVKANLEYGKLELDHRRIAIQSFNSPEIHACSRYAGKPCVNARFGCGNN